MATDWSMPRRGESCTACQRPFEVGQTFRALLIETETGYERHDYCLDCEVPDAPAPVAVWKTRRPEPAGRRVQPFDREAIYGFFERLEDADQPQQVQFRFVLALLLWRKKVLKLERTEVKAGAETWEFQTIRTGQVHRVRRPELDETELERLSAQLEVVLAGGAGDVDLVPADADSDREDENA